MFSSFLSNINLSHEVKIYEQETAADFPFLKKTARLWDHHAVYIPLSLSN